MRHLFTSLFSLLVLSTIVFQIPTFAHVTVSPDSVGVGKRQTFSISVPNEKEIPTTSLRLVVPENLESVSPNVKPGWQININKTGSGEEAAVKEITWVGGLIPAGYRDEFVFRAKVPSSETTLVWKAYQTYQDGTVVSWDQTTEQTSDSETTNTGPASKTQIINDLKPEEKQTDQTSYLPLISLTLSIAALILSIYTLTKKNKTK
jgi:uncharacterized protein YcnI